MFITKVPTVPFGVTVLTILDSSSHERWEREMGGGGIWTLTFLNGERYFHLRPLAIVNSAFQERRGTLFPPWVMALPNPVSPERWGRFLPYASIFFPCKYPQTQCSWWHNVTQHDGIISHFCLLPYSVTWAGLIKGCDYILELDFLPFQFLRTLKLLGLRSVFSSRDRGKWDGMWKLLRTVPDTQ